jgi:hypothetical protein
MRYLSREIAGWLLLLLGIYVFYICFEFVSRRHVFEAAPMVVIGIFLFRGGIHLLKVAIAAEVCLEARPRSHEHRSVMVPRPARARPAARSLPVKKEA